MSELQQAPRDVAPVEPPVQFDEPQFARLLEVDEFLWVSRAREAFGVTGKGLTVAVLDTGLNTQHVDFAGRVIAQRNFTADNDGNLEDATDGNGHGTNVGGIIVANGDHIGVAPEANIIPLKVLRNRDGGSFQAVADALEWVLENRETYNITAVCMSLGDSGNYTRDNLGGDLLRSKIQALRDAKVAVCIAAGNDYFSHNSQQGMGYPGIIRACVSVGAVYDAAEGGFSYGSGARAFSTRPGQITPFSQRLHPNANPITRTDIFAPGAPITSAGFRGEHGESTQHGTSQATPVTAGLILLMQEFYQQVTSELPSVDDLVTWLRRGGVPIRDGDDEDDNVEHTNLEFIRADALSALDAVRRHLQKQMLEQEPSEVVRGEAAPALTIPDDDPAGVSSIIAIEQSGTARELKVSVDITHTFIGDLRVELVAPSGEPAVLHDRAGGNVDNLVATYDSTSMAELAALAGQSMKGDWVLQVSDHAGRDIGTLNKWSIELAYQ